MSSLEKYHNAARSGLHPETAKAFEEKPAPIVMHPETEKNFEDEQPEPESSLPMSEPDPAPIHSEPVRKIGIESLYILVLLHLITIALLAYLIWFTGPAPVQPTTPGPAVIVPPTTPKLGKPAAKKYFKEPAPKVIEKTKVVYVESRAALNTLCYTYGNKDACKKIVVAIPSRVSPLRRYQY